MLRTTILCIFALGATSCSGGAEPGKSVSKRPAPPTVTVDGATVPVTLSFVGTVIAPRDATLSSTRGGRVESWYSELGQSVRAGEVLVRLGASELAYASEAAQAGVAQASARIGGATDPNLLPGVVLARAQLEAALDAARRAERLHAQGSVSEQEYSRSKTAETVAQAQYATALSQGKAELGRLRELRAGAGQAQAASSTDKDIKAPFAGIVLERFVEFGQMAAPNAPLVRVLDPDELYVRFEVPQFEAVRAVLGRRVEVLVDGKVLAAQVIRLTPGLVGQANARRVDARLTEPAPKDLLPGARVPLWLQTGEEEPIVYVPREAATQTAGVWRAWVLKDHRLSERLLSVARVEDERLWVRSGVLPKEEVVLAPQPGFKIGEEVAQ